MTIQLLSELTINQIAAGEVIENPASVIKELVENSIDAGASHITVEVSAGGFQQIVVSDDGSGMDPQNAKLSLERHATSKIRLAEDLFTLGTMGFRGEALASIAAISKMRLLTSHDGDIATLVVVEGGEILSQEVAARSRGTTIEVDSLFYNVPARKKFQKSPARSSGEITQVMTQLALAYPDIGFTLIQNRRPLFELQKSCLKTRAQALLPGPFIASCREFTLDSDHGVGSGLIAPPEHTRINRSGQYLFINQRPVSCPPLSYAIKDAYGTRLGVDQHPVYLLHLKVDPAHIDVNVHPQKKEVRLLSEGLLKYALHGAINTALGSAPALRAPSPFTPQEVHPQELPLMLKEERMTETPPSLFPLPFSLIGLYKHYGIVDAITLPPPFQQEGLALFDLRAVERRLRFDTLLESRVQPSQGLLIPLSFHCSLHEAELLFSCLPLLEKGGFFLERAGKNTFLINALPPFLKEGDVPQILTRVLSSHALDQRQISLLLSEKVSSHYSLFTAQGLIENLLNSKEPARCPKGKPTVQYIIPEDRCA